MNQFTKPKEIRCEHCNKKLCEAEYQVLHIKCPRCKKLNKFAVKQ